MRGTSAEIRKAIQQSDDSVRSLAQRYGINPKTVVRWRRRDSIDDLKVGRPSSSASSLSLGQEALVLACRLHLRLPLDGCLQVLEPWVSGLSRSSLHRCLQRNEVSRLPAPPQRDEAGNISFDLSLLEFGRRRVLVAVERNSRYAHAGLCGGGVQDAADFVRSLIATVPQRIDSLIVDAGAPAAQLKLFRDPVFAQACSDNGIGLRFVRAPQRWTPEQLARGATLIERALASHRPRVREAQLRKQLADWLAGYNSRCVLECLGGRTPAQAIGQKPSERTCHSRDFRKKVAPEPRKAGVLRRRHRAADPANTREAILQAARKCLAHDGPEGLSLAEVARIAGVNRGTAYQHFETRDKLIEATAAGVSERLFQAVFGAVGATSERRVGEVDIAALTDRLAGFAMGNPELCRAWLLNVLSSSEPASDLFWREYRSSAERFDRTEFSRGGVDTEVLSVIMLAGTFLWPVWAHARYGDQQDLGVQAQRFAEESLRLSMYGNLNPARYPKIASRLSERLGITSAIRTKGE